MASEQDEPESEEQVEPSEPRSEGVDAPSEGLDAPSEGLDVPSEPRSAELDALLVFYNQTLRTIGNLPEIPMRRAKLDDVLKALDVDQGVWFIDQLVRGSLWGRRPELDAMYTCADWLIRLRLNDDYEQIQSMYIAAHEAGRDSILYLLRDYPPHRALGPNARLPEVRLPLTRQVTLGEKRQFASGYNRKILDRLVYENEPLVIQKLLINPHIRLADVITIASRRPTKPELLLEVALADSWLKEHAVREALVQNPYNHTGVALKLMPTLSATVLRKLRFATDLHPMITESAALYVELREQRTAPWGH